MIERFKSKARGHCPIANHRYRAGRVSLRLFGDGHPERCANGCRRVADAKRVVRALFSHREGGDSPCLSQRVHPLTTARQNLMRVGLVTYIPDQVIVRRIEAVVKGDGEFDNP